MLLARGLIPQEQALVAHAGRSSGRGHYAFLGEVWIKEARGLAGTHIGPPSC